MAKDPAFLFYSSDFLSGTMLMSDAQVGKYMRLLCFQHQHGHMAEKDMKKICKRYDEDIFCKFTKDDKGLYYNERLDFEINKRVAYSESRKKNRENKEDMNNICESHDEHMENENININKDIKEGGTGGRFKPPTVEEVKAYCDSRKNGIDPEAFIAHYSTNGWIRGKTPIKDWKACVITWEKRKKEKGTTGQAKYFDRPTENYDHLAVDLFAEDAETKYPQYAEIVKDLNKPQG